MRDPLRRIPAGKNRGIVHNSGNVATLYISNIYDGWEQWLLFTSDRHHDSVDCDRAREIEHLEKAKARDAFIVDVGDLYDAMQGKYDPRRTYSNLRPEYKVDAYLDEIVSEAADFYGPYVKNILVLGRGNHEKGVLKHCGTDLTSNLVHCLNSKYGGHIQAGGFGGWVRILCTVNKVSRIGIKVKYFHGAGGSQAPVTRGVIQTNRQAVYLPDADVVVNGHSHDSWYVPITRERISKDGKIYQDIQHHIRTSSYKDEYGDGSGGFHVENGRPPKPLGAVWVRLYVDQSRLHNENDDKVSRRIRIEPILDID